MTWDPVKKPITLRVALEVATHEAIVRETYQNPGDRKTWSIGLTSATGHNVDRYINKPASLERCLEVYIWALDNYADQVRGAFAGVELSEAQFAAALSFHWNTGAIKKSRWVRLYTAGDVDGAREAFLVRMTVGGKPSAGLRKRRTAERDLFFAGNWSATGKITEWTTVNNLRIDWTKSARVDIQPILGRLIEGAEEPTKGVPDMSAFFSWIPRIATSIIGMLFPGGKQGNTGTWWSRLLTGLFAGNAAGENSGVLDWSALFGSGSGIENMSGMSAILMIVASLFGNGVLERFFQQPAPADKPEPPASK